ncbi:TetR family transcriptional regulator [Streptomyces sp. NPDC002896]|uniref:TetR/AcrR family transcriptional regulator n=1 Tax=Streptomyces sp. NPDC002896 TaxID=3154438 RepID=UPI00332321E4
MTAQPGLRERKKLQTAQMLWETAIGLFLQHGFDNVTVTQIAAAANVSKMTVFNYFPAKEDLAMRPMADHVGDPARAVRERARGESAIAALRRDYLAALARRDASTGLNDDRKVLSVHRLLHQTPALAQRVVVLRDRDQQLLAQELAAPTEHPDVLARAAASQLIGTREALITENLRRLFDGESADEVYPDAVAHAEQAFELLATGLHDYCVRP